MDGDISKNSTLENFVEQLIEEKNFPNLSPEVYSQLKKTCWKNFKLQLMLKQFPLFLKLTLLLSTRCLIEALPLRTLKNSWKLTFPMPRVFSPILCWNFVNHI